jgi:serine/threonine protein kinase
MATVFLAHDVKHDRPVALKVLHPALAAALGAERFLREIRITAHLQHPHILTLIDSGEIPNPEGSGPGLLYYVMPYVAGESLRERLTRGALTPPETVGILRSVLDALAHAHSHGIVHRDIKPENIMLTGRHALVMDFIAKAASAAVPANSSSTLTTQGFAIGTPAYMAPEQATGQLAVDARADLYAVGVVAYEMLTGQPPFPGPTRRPSSRRRSRARPPDRFARARPAAGARRGDHALPREEPGGTLTMPVRGSSRSAFTVLIAVSADTPARAASLAPHRRERGRRDRRGVAGARPDAARARPGLGAAAGHPPAADARRARSVGLGVLVGTAR